MNWSFLQAECMDELSIVLAPAVSAEPEAALFDRSRFLPAGEAKGFQLIEAKALEDGVVCSDISQTKQPAVEHDSFEQQGAASFVRQHLSDFSVQSRIVIVLVQIMINRFGPD